ncbi:hypothetical protein BSKO_06584 [Bryopsis sp. KO-2023]|nr:hypothetical protein BSKO_06584 [Bryopsis sp. KO-2023]
MASKVRLQGAGSPKSLSPDRTRCVKCGTSLVINSFPQRTGPFRSWRLGEGNHAIATAVRNIKSDRIRCRAGEGDPDNEGKGTKKDKDLEKFLMYTGTYGGVSGTAAIVLGYLLGIDPFGNLHFDLHDLLIGFECMLPSFFFQFVFLSRSIQQRPSGGKMISIASEDGKMVIEPVSVGSDQAPQSNSKLEKELEILKQATRAYAMKWVLDNSRDIKGTTGSLPLFVLFLTISTLGREMLLKGVGLTALSLWVRDRLYEAGAQDLFFDTNFPTVDAAKWGALIIVAGGILARFGASLQDTKDRREKLKGILDNFATEVQQMSGMENVAKIIDPKTFPDRAGEMVKVYLLQKVVGILDLLLYAVGTSSAFILTGNLLASFAPLLVSEVFAVLQSIERLYEDVKGRELGAAAAEVKDPKKLGELQMKMNDLKVRLLVTAVKRYLELEEASSISDGESGANSESPSLLSENRNGAENGESDEKVDVSVNGEVLLMLVRREIGNLNSSIREENAKEDSDAERLKALESDRTTLSDLLPQVELKVKENPEAQLGTFLGKSKETIGAGRKDSNSDKGGE